MRLNVRLLARAAAGLAALTLSACGRSPLPPPPAPPPLPPEQAPSTTSAPAASPPSTSSPPAPSADASAPAAQLALTMTAVALPGATGAVGLDYLAVDRAAGRVWVPAGGTGSVDVIDAATKQIARVEGFATAERQVRQRKAIVGPSSATIGDGVVYVGNRADSQVCAIDAASHAKGACLQLAGSPDGIAYVASAKEVWVTTPRDSAILVLDAADPKKLVTKTKIALPGSPEGYAVDDAHGLFFTNLEDKDKTLAIDVRTHAVRSTWEPQCGGDGPRGLAFDGAKQILLVACTDRVESMDPQGAVVAKLDTGEGVDNIDYVQPLGRLFVVAGKDAKLTEITVGDHGALTAIATAETAPGTRVVVADANGAAYVADGRQGRILVFSPTPAR